MFRNGYEAVRLVPEERGVLFCKDESRAIQSQKEEADINTIVKRFGLTGQLPQNVRVPTSGDFDTVNDFQTAMNAVVSAQQSFMQMPAHVRKRFGNDPAEFVDFCSNPENLDEMRKLGLANPAVKLDNVDAANVGGSTNGDGNGKAGKSSSENSAGS